MTSFTSGAGIATAWLATSRAVSCFAQGQFLSLGAWEWLEGCAVFAQHDASFAGALTQHQHIGRAMQRLRIVAVRRAIMGCLHLFKRRSRPKP